MFAEFGASTPGGVGRDSLVTYTIDYADVMRNSRVPFVSLCRSLLFLSLILPASAIARQQALDRAADKPNIILIVTDDQGWWDLGVQGNKQIETPIIDRLASEGVRFTHFYASPVCTPTRASLMTGRHYQRTGAFDTYMGRDTLRAEEVTLGEVLQKQGYRTALVGKWHLGRYMKYHPNNRGFDEFFGFWQYGFINRYFDSDELFHNKQPVITTGYITDVLTDQAIAFVERNRKHPFFLYLAYNAPHSPYLVPDSYVERYLKKGLLLSEARIYGMITSIDENMGRLLKTIDETGIRDNTIIIFMSDNGGVSHYFKAGLRGSKGSVYEGGVRVPFIARWPGRFPAGTIVGAMAQHIDVFPTICELVGAPLPGGRALDGKSIVSLLKNANEKTPHRYLFHQWNRVRPVMLQPTTEKVSLSSADGGGPSPNWAVRDARGYKLVVTTAKTKNAGHAQQELFDLERDPGETKDISTQHPDVVRELRDEFAKWFEEVTAGQDYGRVPIEVGRADENPVEIDLTWGEPVGKKVQPTYRHYNRDTIDNWSEVGDSVRWKIDVVQLGRYQIILNYSCQPGDAGSRLLVRVGDSQLEHVTEATAGREVYRPVPVGDLNLSKGPAILEIKPLSIPGKELFGLHKIWLKRVAEKQ